MKHARMKRIVAVPILTFALTAFIAVPSFAGETQMGEIALAGKVGTLGPGLETTLGMTEWLNLRAGGNYLPVSFGGDELECKITMASFPLLVDLHPFRNNFRISGGVIYNGNKAGADATFTDSEEIGDHDYTPAEIGTLSTEVTFRSFGPYVGLGFGNAVEADRTLGFVFDLGVMFQGTPELSLSADGTLANDPTFQSDLAKKKADTQEDLDIFTIYPVLAFGISYHF